MGRKKEAETHGLKAGDDLTTSNLTAGEMEVLGEFHKGAKRRPIWIAHQIRKSRSWVCYVLKRLIYGGHVRKVSRGVYEVTE